MGLRILHTADWHLDSPLRSLPEEAAASVRASLERLPRLIAEVCRREACDMMLLAGDIFDNPQPTRSTVETLKSALAQCGIPVFISPGNHDYCSSDSPWLTEHWPKNVHIFTGSLSYTDVEALNCRVYGAGYKSMDCQGLLEGFRAEGNARWCVGVLHGDPMNLTAPCCPVSAAQVRESGLDYLAMGHIHAKGSYRAGTVCAWPGCPMGRGWDETGEKGVYIVELEEAASLRFLPLGLPQFHSETAVIRTDALSALEAVLPAASSPDFFRVTLTGSGSVQIPKLQRQYAHLGYLLLQDETRESRNLWDWAGEDSLRGLYFQKLQALSREEETSDIASLAAAISMTLLDGREVELP